MKRGLSIVAVGLLCLAWSASARSQDDTTEKARTRFFQGVELYKEGSFEAALAEFKQAYRLNPSYRVLYNIAQTHFELHDYVNSYLTLKDYVQQGGNDIPAPRRSQVDELNQKLEKRIARLDITCNVDGAEVRIDEIAAGNSPLASSVLVNAGPRRVSVVKSGYPVAARIVTVAGGDQVKVKLEMLSPGDLLTPRIKPPPVAASPVIPLIESAPPKKSRRTTVTASLVVAGSCAVATGVFGWLLLSAKGDFDAEVSKTPYDRTKAEDLRSRALAYQYLTDGFAIAALASGGVALYFALTDDSDSAQRKRSSLKQSVAVAPTVGGLVLHGTW
jgi:tetratricopeptide (TPR) repeat protein